MDTHKFIGLRLVIFFVSLLLSYSTLSAPADGMVVGATKIVDNGPDSDRFNLVIMGDGYQEGDLDQFENDAQDFVDFLFQTPPFSTNCSAINVWRVDVTSDESGADDPAPPVDDPMTPEDESNNCKDGTGATAATYFDSTFCADGVIRRLLGSNNATAINVLNAQVPQWDQALILVNSTIYGGSGGSVGVTSLAGTWENIAIHEFGHSAFGLADEYEYWAGCASGETDRDNHPAGEPAQPNVTLQTDPDLVKWKSLFLPTTPVPTTLNDDCTQCDDQANPFPGDTVVGLYEGAHYYHCDAFRPVFNCMMRNFDVFCPVCTQRILDTLAPFQPPNTAPLCDANGPYTAECTGTSTSVALDGTGSTDVDCDVLDFSWTGMFVEAVADGVAPTVHFPGVGVYPINLTVSDDDDSGNCNAIVTIEDTTLPTISAPMDVTAECDGPLGAAVDIGMAVASDSCDAFPVISNDAPALFPIGMTTVTWKATDASGNMGTDTQTITIEDTTPPILTVEVNPETLWSPNHKLVPVQATITVEDLCDSQPTVTLVSITSNEPDNGKGDGDTSNDVQGAVFGTDDRDFMLRAERQGKGEGRVYTITYAAEDNHGNQTVQEATVTVAKSQKK
jgi:hypothetical protein